MGFNADKQSFNQNIARYIKYKNIVSELKLYDVYYLVVLSNHLISQLKDKEQAQLKQCIQISDLNEQVQQYQIQLAAQNKICDELNDQIALFTNQITTLEQTIKQLENKILLLNSNNQKSTYQISKFEYQHNYDMVILLKSVFDLGKKDNSTQNLLNLDSKNRNRIEQDFDERNPGQLKIVKPNSEFNTFIENATVVGMHGLRKRGKTYLLNCLINGNIPSGNLQSTPGICLKYHSVNNSNFVYMDSEGLNCPVSINYQDNQTSIEYFKKKSIKQDLEVCELKKKLDEDFCKAQKDIKVTEQIKQDFIVENSDVLIIVISQLTLDEQKLINELSDKFIDKYTQLHKKIIVVHNLIHFSNPKYIENYINEIMSNFYCYKKNLNSYSTENKSENCTILVDELKPHVNHVFMGRSESEADEIYNRFAVYFIRNEIESCHRISHFDAIERFTKYLNQHLNDYVFFDIDKNISLESIKDSNNYVSYNSESQSITLSDNWKIRNVKDLQRNVFSSIQKDCFYSIYDSDEGDTRYLIVELPGFVDILKEYDQKNGKFHLVVKYQMEEDGLTEPVFTTKSKKEDKSFYITICNEDQMYQYNNNDSEDLLNGLYKFCFSKVRQTSLQPAKIKKASKK
ncbi:hypothetical protein ABPG74_010899 [Tetrahymena malaccensis]